MVQSVTYQRETRTVPFQGKTIVLESLTPVLSPKEKERRKKEIERCLYDVFSKYRQSRADPDNIALRGYQWYNILVRLVAPFP